MILHEDDIEDGNGTHTMNPVAVVRSVVALGPL